MKNSTQKGFVIPLIIALAVILGAGAVYYSQNRKGNLCWPYCPNMTDQDRELIKDQVRQNERKTPEKIATPTDDTDMFVIKKQDWGISFPLPVGWNVTNDVDSQVVLTQVSTGDRITLDFTESFSYTDIDAKRGKVTYSFNDVTRKWIAIEDNDLTENREISNEAKPVTTIQEEIPVFPGVSRWKTYIIPLSHTKFLKVNITGSGQTAPLDEFIKSIIITG